jgi:UDP-N-acetylmuramate--alanine ligase
MFRGKIQNIHFVGIGGSGMNGIAEVMLNMGYTVTGSDLRDSSTVKRLRSLGGEVFIGHRAENISRADVVVKSTAVPATNPEIKAAEQRQIPIIPRAEMLAELMRMKYGIAVAGTHGKTTTTSLLATCLHQAGFDPTIVIGGRLNAIGSSARLGDGDFLVAEADESDGSFMLLSPTVSVITNIDQEHMDHWKSEEALIRGFKDFAQKVPFFGFAALCLDHPVVQSIIPSLRRKVVTYGLSKQADYRAEAVEVSGTKSRFRLLHQSDDMGLIQLNMPGKHNVQNALAAIAVSMELGADFQDLQTALREFSGVERRFTIRADLPPNPGEEPITVIDDYAHHPVEIQATLEAVRQAWPQRRILAVFQPHRYTRSKELGLDFFRSFNDASMVVVCPIYSAGEQPLEGVDQRWLAEGIMEHGHREVHACSSLEEAASFLWKQLEPGDVMVTLGAGNVNWLCQQIGERLHAGK